MFPLGAQNCPRMQSTAGSCEHVALSFMSFGAQSAHSASARITFCPLQVLKDEQSIQTKDQLAGMNAEDEKDLIRTGFSQAQ